MFIDQEALKKILDWDGLIQSIEAVFETGCEMPIRHHHSVAVTGQPDATLLLMPAWTQDGFLGVKLVNVFPSNGAIGLPSIHSLYTLSSATTGERLAMMDGGELTARRTAAASALASRFWSRTDATSLLMVGTGRLAFNLIEAHASQRPITTVNLWGRRLAQLEVLAQSVTALGLNMNIFQGDAIEQAVKTSDIISCATLSNEPLIKGEWLQAGCHVDLVGGFTPTMREADDEAIRRATVSVDTRTGAMKEAGDIVVPLETGILQAKDIAADLYDLCRGVHRGRSSEDEITLFKSVGAACEDLAGAMYAYKKFRDLN